MRVTEQVIDNEVAVRGWLTQQRAWVTWHDDRDKRERSTPTLVALHIPSRMVLAIYARPRKLRPSELPDVSWLPAGWVPVVWWPGMSTEVRAWLAAPVVDPPGVVSTTLARQALCGLSADSRPLPGHSRAHQSATTDGPTIRFNR